MKAERKYITTKDWIAFFISTFLIFLSSLLLVISGVIFHLLHLVKKRPVLVCASVFFFDSFVSCNSMDGCSNLLASEDEFC